MMMLVLLSCNSGSANNIAAAAKDTTQQAKSLSRSGKKHFKGIFSNGMKGDSISFDISEDGTRLENLTFKGWWRCDGKIEHTTAGPEGSFAIRDGKVNDHISEPPNGGSTAWRFDLEATIASGSAEGTFRMNINNLGCNTYKLNWTAKAE